MAAATMASLLLKRPTMASKPPSVTLLPPLKWRNPAAVLLPPLLSIKKSTSTTDFIIKSSSSNSSRGSDFSLQCVMNSSSKNCFFMEEEGKRNQMKKKKKKNPFERFAEVMFKPLQIPNVSLAVLLGGLLGLNAILFWSLHLFDPATAASRTAIVFGVFLLYDLYRLISAFSLDSRRKKGGSIRPTLTPALGLIVIIIAVFMVLSGLCSISIPVEEEESVADTQKTTVLKLQVALLGTTRSLRRDFDWPRMFAGAADMSTAEGFAGVLFSKDLQDTTSALLMHPDYCISGYSSVDVMQNKEDGHKHFKKLSIEEQGRSNAATLVNVNTIKRERTSSNIKIIMVTILVAAEGVHELPAINGCADLEEALQKLGSISSDKTMSVKVLWTPLNGNDTLTERELLEDYPLLRPL